MSQPPQTQLPVSLEKAWQRLMFSMGGTNTQRAKDAKKFADALTRDRKRY